MVKAIPKVSIARNGLGSYIQPCYKITLQYCNWGGSSQGLRDLLTNGKLNQFALNNLQTIFEIKQQRGHPLLICNYNNNTQHEVEIKNLSDSEIIKKLDEYIQRSGNERFKYNHKVMSDNDSVRGIWSPLFEPKDHRHKI
ncbi:unnamed protein product [Candida verbasci]|uniref:Large ribosomal subunit protein mL43 n=1 Tax=Candida verbasci TaxID=1227364 RepID=A0A9W4XCE4_9ASCO|nr:unnamed protein product [Candida verbasci]